jgi:hypothetical protein
MKINIAGMEFGANGPGCVIGIPAREEGLGFRSPNQSPGFLVKTGVVLGAFTLAAGSALGMVRLGYDKDTAVAVSVAAAKTSIAASLAATQIAERRKRRQLLLEARRRKAYVSPSTAAPAADQRGGAN